jgi:hypothetical protein
VNISKYGEIEANSLSFKFDASQYRENMEIKLYVHFFSSSFQVSGGWRHSMALMSNGQLFGWGWNKFGQVGIGHNFDCSSPMLVNFPHAQKVVQVSCGWRHTLAVTDRANVYSWGRGANGQLGHGDTLDRNIPKIIDAFSVDGCSEKHIESSKYPSSAKPLASLSERYAVVPNETAMGSQASTSDKGDKFDANVPESDVSFDGIPIINQF